MPINAADSDDTERKMVKILIAMTIPAPIRFEIPQLHIRMINKYIYKRRKYILDLIFENDTI